MDWRIPTSPARGKARTKDAGRPRDFGELRRSRLPTRDEIARLEAGLLIRN